MGSISVVLARAGLAADGTVVDLCPLVTTNGERALEVPSDMTVTTAAEVTVLCDGGRLARACTGDPTWAAQALRALARLTDGDDRRAGR